LRTVFSQQIGTDRDRRTTIKTLENIARASVWMQAVKADKILNTDFICLRHKKMFGDVWKWAEKYRKAEKNIGIRYIDIPVEVHKLCVEASRLDRV
jgi:fido (protein-threonine AMPylation protein)